MRHAWRTLSLLAFCGLLSWAWGSAAPALTRGPYLQSATPTSLLLVCRTDTQAAVSLRYGTRAGPPWDFELHSPADDEHVFSLTGLRPETRYAYELSSGNAVLARGDSYSFTTLPPPQSRAPFRFLAWGDSGTGNGPQLDVAARMERVLPVPDFALVLGDIVYEEGEWENYDPRFFAPYAELWRRTAFWTTLGNHDVGTDDGAPYFQAFHLPTTTGAPGHPSGTEHYYSFDHGMAHFTCADSEASDSAPGSPMYQWLADDLAAARARGKRWLVVFMHHPPYTRGTHDSDEEGELIRLRDNLVPLFEAQGVDLVLTGHSHNYERSFLARDSAVFQDDPADYSKIQSADGTLYLVSGCGGRTGTGPLDHPLMARSFGEVAGFSLIDVSWEELRGSFVERDGRTTDLFTLRKADDVQPPRIAAVEARSPGELALVFSEPVEAGTGATGAEDPARYLITPAVTLLDAALDSDQRTVVLSTASLEPNRTYDLAVLGVADGAGNVGQPRARFLLALDPTHAVETVVPQGSEWRHRPGSAAPPLDWKLASCDDSAWLLGPAGFGYGDDDDATLLADMRDGYVSLYLRHAFELADPSLAAALELLVSYDDGFVAFLNGIEIARANVPGGQTHTTPASASIDAAFEPFDASAFLSALRTGTNVLAVEGHNAALSSNDFSLHPALTLTLDSHGGPPRAVASSLVHTANAPARIVLSGARSSDEDGPLVDWTWDFGDGTPRVQGADVAHRYDTTGLFTASLSVTDGDGLQSLAELPIRIHAEGAPPLGSLAASALVVEPGTSVAFSSPGLLDPDGGELFARWDFGDPASGPLNHSQDAAPVHPYWSSGTHLATLVVVDDEGSTLAHRVALTVQPPAGPVRAFHAVADAMVRSTSPTNNYGSESALRVRGGVPEWRTYLRFLLSGLESVSSARLRLYVTDGSNQGGTLFAVDGGWSEETIHWSGAPLPAGPALGAAGAVATGSWLEFDVTSALGGDGSYAFLLHSTSTDSAYFSSREGAHPPELVISAGPPPDRTRPLVLARDPAPGALSVALETRITVRFDEPVQGVGAASFLLRRDSTPVAAQVSYDEATRTAVLDPLEDLLPATSYLITLTDGISDLAPQPNSLAPSSWIVTTLVPPAQILTPEADAMVKSTSPGTNYGSDPTLRVRASSPEWRSYLRFPVSGGMGPVTSARLRLYASDGSDDGGALYAVADDWGEGEITWTSAPPVLGAPLASAGAVGAHSWVEYDVTPLVAGAGSYSFALLSSSTNSAYFSSREGANPPQLLVEFSAPESGPPGRPGPVPSGRR